MKLIVTLVDITKNEKIIIFCMITQAENGGAVVVSVSSGRGRWS